MQLKNVTALREWCRIKKLYRKAFPANERKPFSIIRKKHAQKEADVWILDNRGEFIGFAITMNVGDRVLLDYFAVDAKKRGLGYGSEALNLLQEYYKDVRFFLEIERVDVEADNLVDRQRRKAFYCNNGMSELGVKCRVFGVEMELLGHQCEVTFEEYYDIYYQLYGEWAARNIIKTD